MILKNRLPKISDLDTGYVVCLSNGDHYILFKGDDGVRAIRPKGRLHFSEETWPDFPDDFNERLNVELIWKPDPFPDLFYPNAHMKIFWRRGY